MEEEQKKPSSGRHSYRFYKILTLTLFSLFVIGIAGYGTVEFTSSSGFCGSCHEMNPEYNTWKASSHSNVACKECHIKPDVVSYAKAKANGLVELYSKATDSYTAPLSMPEDIPNSQCELCHNMKNRQTSADSDIIIPHDKHLAKDINCVTCHYGVAHGDVKDRNVTFKTDYDKWSSELGKQMMSVKYTQPKMEDCINCHERRDVSTACKTCHSTGMKPKSHDDPNFLKGKHGTLAEKDIKKCNSCHSLMSDNEINSLDTKTASQKFLQNKSEKDSTISAEDYAKENTYCSKCHEKKPASHVSGWNGLHGAVAKTDEQKCYACHSDKTTGTSTITSNGLTSNAVSTIGSGSTPACTSCHPALHDGKDYRTGHPVDLTGITKPNATCYSCHSKPNCTSCHKEDE